jgi:hypothetical protein
MPRFTTLWFRLVDDGTAELGPASYVVPCRAVVVTPEIPVHLYFLLYNLPFFPFSSLLFFLPQLSWCHDSHDC